MEPIIRSQQPLPSRRPIEMPVRRGPVTPVRRAVDGFSAPAVPSPRPTMASTSDTASLPQQSIARPSLPIQPAPTVVAPLPVTNVLITEQTIKQPRDFSPQPTPKRRFGRRYKIAALIVIILLCIGGGSAAAYVGIVVPNKPENLLMQALANTFNGTVKSQTMTGTFKTDSFNGTMTGATAANGNFDVHLEADYAQTPFTADIVSADAKTAYVRTSGLPKLADNKQLASDQAFIGAMMDVYKPILNTVDNQWYKTAYSSKALSTDDAAKLANVYQANQFLKINSVYKPEKINNRSSQRYEVIIDGPLLKQFLIHLKDANIQSFAVSQDELSVITSTIDSASFKDYPIDIWVDKDLKIISQIGMTHDDSTATITFSNFNKPVNISVPSTAKDFSELSNQLDNLDTSNLITMSGLATGNTSGIDSLLMTQIP